MTGDLQELFTKVMEHPTAEREALARELCSGPVLTRLLDLIRSDSEAEDTAFWRSPVAEDPWIGRTLGPWRLTGVLGRGGMGTVYRALRSDSGFEQWGALKLVTGGLDTDLLLSRFRAERQILARLSHPNIARLLDGGSTAAGIPYLVMEFLDGEPIDRYCRRLDREGILLLFLKVCSAVHYAHQHLVIHRDLKPANILVTADGDLKLLDFGLAKLLDPGPDDAATIGATMLTPRYASPEQVRGEAITTASDVYSLGVVLYELLNGESPYGSAITAPAELVVSICEREPREQGLGDLDRILAMALRKNASSRYASVEQFADDIQRYMARVPVRAHPDSVWYRVQKFTRRNLAAVTAGCVAAVLAITAAAGITWEAARAERRFQDVRKLANFYLFEFNRAIQDVPGTLAARQMVVSRSIEYLDSLARESGGDHGLERELAAAYGQVARLTFNVDGALGAERKAQTILERLVRAEPANASYRQELASVYQSIASLEREAGNTGAATEDALHALAVLRQLPGSDAQAADIKMDAGRLLADVGRTSEALQLHQDALETARELLRSKPNDVERRRIAMLALLFMSRTLLDSGEQRRALQHIAEASVIAQDLLSTNPASTLYQRDAWVAHFRAAEALAATDDFAGAEAEFRRAAVFIDRLVAADRGDRGHWHASAMTSLGLAKVLGHEGKLTESRSQFRKAIEIAEQLVRADPNKVESQIDRALIYGAYAQALRDQALIAKARKMFDDVCAKDRANVRLAKARAELLNSANAGR